MTDTPIALDYARDALAILRTSLDLARAGQPVFYRVAAVQLRLLLCDTARLHGRMLDTALLPKVMPDLALYPIDASGAVDTSLAPRPLPEWLHQALPVAGDPTVRTFIRRVCDRHGGAHVDARENLTIKALDEEQRWIILGSG
ncbi:MAG: hypothetical protein HPY76_15315 [Anaerolineae bacterium]|nr:hypothetical protein [Anaerolineae bacterium]